MLIESSQSKVSLLLFKYTLSIGLFVAIVTAYLCAMNNTEENILHLSISRILAGGKEAKIWIKMQYVHCTHMHYTQVSSQCVYFNWSKRLVHNLLYYSDLWWFFTCSALQLCVCVCVGGGHLHVKAVLSHHISDHVLHSVNTQLKQVHHCCLGVELKGNTNNLCLFLSSSLFFILKAYLKELSTVMKPWRYNEYCRRNWDVWQDNGWSFSRLALSHIEKSFKSSKLGVV